MTDARKALGYAERKDFAELVGLKPDTLGSYERGVAKPDMELLAIYRQRFGISLSWLIADEGDMFADPSKGPAPSTEIDPLLMEKLYKAVERAYRDAGQRPPGHRVANEATTLFNELLGRVKDVRDDAIVDAVVPVLANELIERLGAATLEPGTGKRSAS